MPAPPARYRLVRARAAQLTAPELEDAQRRVVDHRGGPLLVLAGPGTGKTTTLVESVVARVRQGERPEQLLVLTFSRRAALELRTRITARLGRTVATPSAWTFHAFCYALLRESEPATEFSDPLRLLSAAEQDVMLRELVRGAVEDQSELWPPPLRPALGTRGFAEELRALLARVRDLGLEPSELSRAGELAGRAEWQAAGRFLAGYLDVLDAQRAVDYPELVHRVAVAAGRPDRRDELRRRFVAVFVDEYQDTDHGQERLLAALAGDGRDLVVFGDPDQSIYRFRGAEVRNLLEFPERFRRRDGAPAEVVALSDCRRTAGPLLAASRSIAAGIPLGRLPAGVAASHRALRARPDWSTCVEVHTYPSIGAEAEAIAELLRRAHLCDGMPWSEMAVLVRSALRSVPLLRRALSAAGVPVVVAGDELPLAAEPAVAPLLAALRCAEEPRQLSPELARTLLLSPLGGLDPVDLRRLGRLLRDRARAAAPGVMPPASAELVRRVLVADEPMPAAPSRLSDPLRRLAGLLRDAGATLRSGGAAEQALWQLWSGTDWPARLLAASAAGGQAGRAADRDLDAVLALFDTFARAEERRPGRGASNLLAEIAAQQIPAEGLAERGPPGAGVRLLTAHRAKGLEWELVVVAGVQEEAWPDLRRRGSLLGAERLGPDGEVPPPSLPELLADERRLFYVAVSRARRRLLVTAVAAEGTDGMRPSRFLDELGVGAVEHPVPAPPFSLPGLVARLRLAATDPEEPPALRAAAVRGLARLAADAPPDSGAHPDRWWGLTERSEPGQPIHDPAQPVRLSATSLAGVEECPLRWFLRHEVRAEPPTGAALAFGGLLHALADAVGSGRAAPDARQLIRQLDRVWSAVAFEAPWRSEQERVEAGRALQRLLDWHAATRGRRLVATEVPFEVSLRVAGRDVLLRGFVDRLELDDADAVHVVDFKTGRRPPAATQAAGNLQLGCYQLAVASGGFDRHPALPAAPRPAGAELVWLRSADRDGLPRVHRQAGFGDSGPPGWLTEALEQTVLRLAAEEFPARPGRYCARCTFRACCPAQPDGRQLFA